MEYKAFTKENISEIIPLYIDYYNNATSYVWTEETVYKSFSQRLSRDDSYGFILVNVNCAIGFVIGYFEQFDDGVVYNLIEIVIAKEYQSQGLGTKLMLELQSRVKAMGAMLINLQAVNDNEHDKFYGRLGYNNCKNLILKVKIL